MLKALIIGIVLAGPALAAPPIAGAEDAAMQAALSVWLEGDEAVALPAMAALAAGGNAAARLLLGVVNVTPALQGPWIGAQDRAVRITLLRKPEAVPSLSGKSWFSSPDDPRAAIWGRTLQADAPMTVILDFARLDEPRAAAEAAFRLMSRQRRGFAALAGDPDFPAALAPYAALERGSPARLDPADPHRALFGPHEPTPDSLSGWIAGHADAVAALCQTLCPDEPAGVCGPAVLAGLGGPMGLLHTGSPVEGLVPSATFNRRPKGVEMMLALMSPTAIATAPVPSQCLTDAMK